MIESGRPLKTKRHDRLAQRDHRLHQLFLPADQVQAGAVAHVVERPGLARGLLVAADGQHDDVGIPGDFDRLGDLPAILFRIAGHHRIDIPASADGDLAALAVEHLDMLADFGLDAVEHRDVVLAARRCNRPAGRGWRWGRSLRWS